MAETKDQVKAEIAQTRAQLGSTIDAIADRVDSTKRRIPFYGMQRRQLLMIAGGAAAATAGLAFMAFYARNPDAGRLMRRVRCIIRRRL